MYGLTELSTYGLREAVRRVMTAMNEDPRAGEAMLRARGKGGLVGVSLHASPPGSQPYPGKRAPSPFPPADDWRPSNPGVVESDEDDDDGLEMGVQFPDRSTNRSRRKKGK